MNNVPDRLPIPEPLPETRLVARPLTLRSRLQAILNAARLGNEARHKIGGEPDWIQDDETPECCGQPAMFYGQLGSLGGKYDLIDNGIVYVFICRKCLRAHAVFQFS